MAEVMMDELKRLIVEHMELTRKIARSYGEQKLDLLATKEWSRYFGLDWVLDTIAELEIRNGNQSIQE